MFDVLGSGRVASIAVTLLARSQPRLGVQVVTPRRIRGTVDPDHLATSRAPLVIATSIDEGHHLASRPWSRAALAEPNLAWILDRLPPRVLAGRLVIVVTNPVEPIVDALARLEPTACVVGFGLSVDRARFLEVLGRERGLRLCGVAGTHAGDAVAQLAIERGCDPRTLVEQLRHHRSPFAPRVRRSPCASIIGVAVDALAADVDAAARGDRARVFVEMGARALCEAERAGASPPARRGGFELAGAISRLVGGRRVLVSSIRGPAHLAMTPHGAELSR